MDVDVRYVQLTGAGQARERITQHDDAERYYTYDYMDGPLVRDAMSSRFAVHSTADGVVRSSLPSARHKAPSWRRR